MQAQVYNQMDPSGNITQRDEFGNNGSFNPNRRDTTKQNKEVPIGLRFWKIDRRFGDVIPSEPDTIPHLYQNSIYATGLYGQYNTLGNNYTSRINRIFIDRPETSQFYFTQPYDFTTKQPDEFLFVNTLSPYTHITYETCGDKQNGEDHIDAKFAVNAGKRVGIGFDLDYHYATGYYANQNNSHFRATLFGSYIGDQYQMHTLLTFHHRKATESGGIVNDEYITHPEAQETTFTEEEIPTVLSSNWNRNNREKFSTLMAMLYGQLTTNPIGSALWYDTYGVMYSIPVNAARPSLTANLFLNYTTALDAGRLWSLTLSGSAGYTSSSSYQAKTSLQGLDKDSFDYSAFMSGFWGSADGDRFYGGLSGFEESRTQTFNPTANISVKYNQDHYSFSVGTRTNGRIARYSLNPNADLNTLETHLTAMASYTTKHEFELNTDLSYVFYKGYSEGYGQPEWQWNADISKNIGAFNLSIMVHDILNQTRNLTHTVTANYEEDSYRLVMGRYILFGVKWNFGKMNAAHSARAQQAAMGMLF